MPTLVNPWKSVHDIDGKGLDWRTMNVMATVRVIVEHKETSEGAVLQEDVRPISVSRCQGRPA